MGIFALLLAVFTIAKSWFSATTGWELAYPLDTALFFLTASASVVLGLVYFFFRKSVPVPLVIGRVVLSLCFLLAASWFALGRPGLIELAFMVNSYARWETNRSFPGPSTFPSPNKSLKLVMYEHPCGGIGDTGVMLVLEGIYPISKVMLIRDQGGFTTDCISAIKWIDNDHVLVNWRSAQPMTLSICDRTVDVHVD